MNRIKNIIVGAASMAMLSWIVLKPRTGEVLAASSAGLNGWVRAATADPGPLRDLRTAAERFAADASAAISDFWKGFGE